MTGKTWLQVRLQGLGGSDIAALFGTSPWQSRLTLWAEKAGKTIPEDISHKEFIEWGNILEPVIIERYWEKTQRVAMPITKVFDEDLHSMIECEGGEIVFRHNEHQWAQATPDGFIAAYEPLPWETHANEKFEGPGVLEVKTTNAFKAGDWKDGPPPYYMLQAQHYMLVTGCKWASFAVLIGGQEMRVFDVARDESLISDILERGTYFWLKNVLGKEPPRASGLGSEGDLLARLYPTEDPDKNITLPDHAKLQAEAMDQLDEQIRPLEKQIRELKTRREACRNNLKLLMMDASIGQTEDGSLLVTHKTTNRKGYTVEPKSYRQMRIKRVRTS